ncbi:hypothetical protein ACFVY1_37125 [Streptomyces sp. NPDC058293]|uniref:hypothetical protein n=1 Tax=Streptomyces sp. NPDC058293 TaxID=3346429 RepID=UPI0036E5BA18
MLRVGSRPEADGPPVLAAGPMLNPDRECTNEPFSLGEKDGNLVMTDGSLILTVELATGRLSYHGPDGQLLFRELSADAVHFERRAPTGPTEPFPGYRTRLGLQLTEGEALFGLGQHEEGRLNRRGTVQYLYQHNLKTSVPFLQSSRGWGLLWHGYSAMTFQDDRTGCRIQSPLLIASDA